MMSASAYPTSQSYHHAPDESSSIQPLVTNYQPPIQAGPPSSALPTSANPFAAEYLNGVKENRSVYGNYLDNSYTYDPHKDKKSHFNTVYETDAYNPWGKPGGGAPKLDGIGHVKTKIVGTLKWNLNGETEEDRFKRLANGNRIAASPTKNTLMYRKFPQQPMNSGLTPRSTYNETFQESNGYNAPQPQPQPRQSQFGSQSMQDLTSMSGNFAPPPPTKNHQSQLAPPPMAQSYIPPPQQSQYQYPSSSSAAAAAAAHLPPITQLEREAHIRSFERMNSNSLNGFGGGGVTSAASHKMLVKTKNEQELNRVSNKLYNDNGPSDRSPNTPFWFGRTGSYNSTSLSSFNNAAATSSSTSTLAPSGQYVDVRRRKLLDALENRAPTQTKFATSASNEYLPNSASNNAAMFVYPSSSTLSNHRNRYEYPAQQI